MGIWKKLLLGIPFYLILLGIFLPPFRTYGQIGVMPDNIQGERSWLIYKLKPGNTITDGIILSNAEEIDNEIEIYGVDAYMNPDNNAFVPKSQDQEKLTVGKWIILPEKNYFLKKNEIKIVSFELKIPDDTKPGEYGGGIVIQKKTSEKEKNGGITIKTRTALRLYVTIEDVNIEDANKEIENKKNTLNNRIFKESALNADDKNQQENKFIEKTLTPETKTIAEKEIKKTLNDWKNNENLFIILLIFSFIILIFKIFYRQKKK